MTGKSAESQLDSLVEALDFDVLDKQPPEDLPALATEALANGVDSPSLRELAGTNPRDYQEARDLFRAAMSELGVPTPNHEEARWRCARRWAKDMIDGTRSPAEASRLIWWEAWEPLGRPEKLTRFVGLASEWEDDPPRRELYETDMRSAAEELLAGN